jgi:hypothetical protein
MEIKISVLTPSIREPGLEIVQKALRKQTFTDFEWLIGSPFNPKKVYGEWVPDNFTGGCWTLNRMMNKMISKASGELLISWQDFTYAKPDTLEKFYYHYLTEPTMLVGAVGNKYEDETWQKQTWQDPRERSDQGNYYNVNFNDVEWNLCSVPKQALFDIGGLDEGMDMKFFGMDGFNVNHRLKDSGLYDFKLDQTIKSYSLGHGRVEDWDKVNGVNGLYLDHVKERKAKKEWPYLDYLPRK